MTRVGISIEEHIAEVIYSHEPTYIGKNPSCDCGRWNGVAAGRESHADHLAAEIVAELAPGCRILGFITDGPLEPRNYTDADAEVWVE